MFSMFVVTLSFFVALPSAAVTMSALQLVIQFEHDVARDKSAVVMAVERLELRGLNAIFLHDVAAQAVFDTKTTARCLTLLRRSGQLRWTQHGYRIAKPKEENKQQGWSNHLSPRT